MAVASQKFLRPHFYILSLPILLHPRKQQRSEGKDLVFEFEAGIKVNKENISTFKGPFIQGPSDNKFVYMDTGTCAGQQDSTWSRRLKIPIANIAWNRIRQLSPALQYILETKVPGTIKDGRSGCGTAKFSGW